MSDLVSVVRSLPEALGNTVREPDGVVYQSGHRGDQATIFDAASLLAGLFAECPHCEGNGWAERKYDSVRRGTHELTLCPSCRGGVVIKPDIIEKAAKAIEATMPGPELDWSNEAEAALWAVFGGEE